MSDLKARPEEARNVKRAGHSDINGWGDAFQVIVREDKWCYVAASGMNGHEGTSVLNVEDPRNPKVVAQLPAPTGTHSHKVLFLDDVMILNAEDLAVVDAQIHPNIIPAAEAYRDTIGGY